MHIRRGFLGWGVFLILAGAVPLAVRAGYLTADQVSRLWTLWPLILIGIGLGLILRRTGFEFIGGIVVAAAFGLMAGGLLTTGVGAVSSGTCGPDTGTVAFPVAEGTLTEGGTVNVDIGCGNVTVGVAPGTGWRLEGRNADGQSPDVASTDRSLRIRARDAKDGGLAFFGKRDSWQVTLPDAGRLDIDLKLNAGQTVVDLRGASVGAFGVNLNAGAATVDLSATKEVSAIDIALNAGSLKLALPAVSTTGSIHANAGSVALCAPPDVALKLRTGESIISSYDYGKHGLVQSGSTWATPGFDSASTRIELRTEANAGSFVLDPEDGCD